MGWALPVPLNQCGEGSNWALPLSPPPLEELPGSPSQLCTPRADGARSHRSGRSGTSTHQAAAAAGGSFPPLITRQSSSLNKKKSMASRGQPLQGCNHGHRLAAGWGSGDGCRRASGRTQVGISQFEFLFKDRLSGSSHFPSPPAKERIITSPPAPALPPFPFSLPSSLSSSLGKRLVLLIIIFRIKSAFVIARFCSFLGFPCSGSTRLLGEAGGIKETN